VEDIANEDAACLEESQHCSELMFTPKAWRPLASRKGSRYVIDLVGMGSFHGLPAHRLTLLAVLQLAVKDRATELRFEPWRFVKDECGEDDEGVGHRLFYEVDGTLLELERAPCGLMSYCSREIETIARLGRLRSRVAHTLRRIASKIDGRETGPRWGSFALSVDDGNIDVEVLAYSSELGERYFLGFSPISTAISHKVCAAMRRLHGISDDRPCSKLFGSGDAPAESRQSARGHSG
jgi:hypothetical protein